MKILIVALTVGLFALITVLVLAGSSLIEPLVAVVILMTLVIVGASMRPARRKG